VAAGKTAQTVPFLGDGDGKIAGTVSGENRLDPLGYGNSGDDDRPEEGGDKSPGALPPKEDEGQNELHLAQTGVGEHQEDRI
jgi:hypothetical protein